MSNDIQELMFKYSNSNNTVINQAKTTSANTVFDTESKNSIFTDNPIETNINELSAVMEPPILKPKYKDNGTKDGQIENTKQRGTGNCWLLSGINAMSYTEEGRNIIKNALEYKNGYTIVHTMVGDYTVTDDELATVKSYTNWIDQQYSTGDDDMLILELATEKVIDDIDYGKVKIDDIELDWWNTGGLENPATTIGHSSTSGGFASSAIYLFSGKIGERTASKSKFNSWLDEYQQNKNQDLTLCANVEDENKTIKDVNGKKVALTSPHAYAIKNVTDDTVTVINPWDSSKEIVVLKQDFIDNFSSLEKTNLISDSCESLRLDKPEVSEDTVGSNQYKTEVIKNSDGTIANKTYISSNGKTGIRYYYESNGDALYATIGEYDDHGVFQEKNCFADLEIAQNILKRGLLNIERFDYKELGESCIGILNDEQWESVKNLLYVPGLDNQLSAHEIKRLGTLSDDDRNFALEAIRKYPNINRNDIISYSDKNCNYITVEDLEKYKDTDTSFINRILSDSLKNSWWDFLDLQFTFKDCIKHIADNNNSSKEMLYQRIIDRRLMLNPYIERELSGTDIYYLSFITDANWDKAMEYLQSKQNMSGKEIYEKLCS